MKKLASFATVSAAALMLAACGSSDSASEQAQADNVEMPAEEAVGDIEAAATPVADAATGASSDAAAAASEAAPSEAAKQ
jgi:PBP1b-binding outer membrane lipoprotein LpoB